MKGFLYLWFKVSGKYFLNYRRARSYYHSLEGSKSFDGLHILRGLERFGVVVAFEDSPIEEELKACQEYYKIFRADAEL